MAPQKNKMKKEITIGWIYFSLFAILILSGIFVKRILGHPEFMMMFHLPAAVFLVLAGKKITVKLKAQYEKQTNRSL